MIFKYYGERAIASLQNAGFEVDANAPYKCLRKNTVSLSAISPDN
jgi:hypothetical protein